jgi:non-heme chloroperoxidase
VSSPAVHVGNLTVQVARPGTPSARPDVVLIHGLCGGAWQWEGYQALLARHGYASHALNLRGHHDSRPVPDIGRVSIQDYVDDALEVAGRFERPIVVGHSMGGLVAQKVAEAGACRALVLITPAPPRWIPIASWSLLRRQVRYVPALLRERPLFMRRQDADALIFNRTPRDAASIFFSRMVPDSGRAGLEMSAGSVAVNESQVTTPVLVMVGRDDRFIVPRIARAVARKYGAELRSYHAFGHLITTEPGWEGPAAEMVEWLDQRQ